MLTPSFPPAFKSEGMLVEMAIYHTGEVFSYLPHHLDLASEDSVGHSTCKCVGASQGYHGVL